MESPKFKPGVDEKPKMRYCPNCKREIFGNNCGYCRGKLVDIPQKETPNVTIDQSFDARSFLQEHKLAEGEVYEFVRNDGERFVARVQARTLTPQQMVVLEHTDGKTSSITSFDEGFSAINPLSPEDKEAALKDLSQGSSADEWHG